MIQFWNKRSGRSLKKVQKEKDRNFEQPVEWRTGLTVLLSASKPFIKLHVQSGTCKDLLHCSTENPETHTQWRPTVTHNHWITVSSSRAHTHTHKCDCPVMQRERVSKDKAISRSEYRQTEGIVLYADTRTHTQQKIGTDRKDGLLDPRMKFTTQRERIKPSTLEKSQKSLKKKTLRLQTTKLLNFSRHHL